MEIATLILALTFLVLSVWYADYITRDFSNEKTLLLKVSIILVVVLLSMYIIDVFIFNKVNLLRNEVRDQIIEMIKYLFIGIVLTYIYNEKK